MLQATADGATQWYPRGEDVSLTDELLMVLIDRLGALYAVESSQPLQPGGKRQRPPPAFPRPVRELDRARGRAEQQYLEELDDDVQAAQQRWATQREEVSA